MRRPLVAGRGVEAARAAFRRRVRRMRRDRVMAPDIERARSWVADGGLRQSIDDAGIKLDR